MCEYNNIEQKLKFSPFRQFCKDVNDIQKYVRKDIFYQVTGINVFDDYVCFPEEDYKRLAAMFQNCPYLNKSLRSPINKFLNCVMLN